MASSLFRELSAGELAKLLDASLHAGVRSARLLTGGMFNTTYLVDTLELGPVVLRVGPVNRHLLMPFEHRLMEAEAQVYDLCARNGVPVSEVLALDVSKSIIDRDYMIVRHIPSQPMTEAQLTPEDHRRICGAIGAATARMHGIQQAQFGRIVDVAEGRGFSRWSDCLCQELAQWETVAASAPFFPPETRRQIRELFARSAPYLDEIRTPCLIHTDLWFGNILIRTGGPRPEFAAIIDADRALWGDPEFEFSAIRWMIGEETFWQGYGRAPAEGQSTALRQGIYLLLNCLWNSYVYLREYNQPENAQGEWALALEKLSELRRLLGA